MMKARKSSAPMVMMNSVMTNVPRIGDTRSASDMISLTKSYSRMISINIKPSKNTLMLSLKILVYENSSLIIRKMAVKMQITKK